MTGRQPKKSLVRGRRMQKRQHGCDTRHFPQGRGAAGTVGTGAGDALQTATTMHYDLDIRGTLTVQVQTNTSTNVSEDTVSIPTLPRK